MIKLSPLQRTMMAAIGTAILVSLPVAVILLTVGDVFHALLSIGITVASAIAAWYLVIGW
jgi:hypothetical protein